MTATAVSEARPVDATVRRRWRPSPEALAAYALALVYLAVMSGHLSSMDGLFMERQAYALVFEHSVRFQTPLWIWKPDPVWNSKYGIGLSLLYVPGMVLAAALRSRVPLSTVRPEHLDQFYWRELYNDPLYTVGASWVHALVAAAAAYLVARLVLELGFSRRAALWALAFYGLGSSALVYARGDFAQSLEGLCWVAALLAAVRYRRTLRSGALLAAGAAVCYAILTRPVEGMLLVPAVAAVALPALSIRHARAAWIPPLVAVGAGVLAGLAGTLFVNWARFGDPFTTGYLSVEGWVFPGAMRWAGVLVSPGRGILWEFPAVLLVPVGVVAIARRGDGRTALAVSALCAVLLVNVASWFMWWGGWCWGLRLFTPATPLLAALAGVGVERLGPMARRWVPWLLLAGGFVWALPGAVTDILGGYGLMADGTAGAFKLAAYPPLGAWRFLKHWRAQAPVDWSAADILWFRLARETGNWSLVVPAVLMAAALAFAVLAWRGRRAPAPLPATSRQLAVSNQM